MAFRKFFNFTQKILIFKAVGIFYNTGKVGNEK